MPAVPSRTIDVMMLTDAPGSVEAARRDLAATARDLAVLAGDVSGTADATARDLASLEEGAWALARALSQVIGRVRGTESARALILSTHSVTTSPSTLADAA
jgi:hypothetical protein